MLDADAESSCSFVGSLSNTYDEYNPGASHGQLADFARLLHQNSKLLYLRYIIFLADTSTAPALSSSLYIYVRYNRLGYRILYNTLPKPNLLSMSSLIQIRFLLLRDCREAGSIASYFLNSIVVTSKYRFSLEIMRDDPKTRLISSCCGLRYLFKMVSIS